MAPQKWKLLSKKDVFPSKWFPIESREYQLPSGQVITDFTITTLPDAAMIIPITVDQKVVLVNQYRPGADAVMLEFPAGRIEPSQLTMLEAAQAELEEETGIKVTESQLHHFATLTAFPTKGTEKVFSIWLKIVTLTLNSI